MAKIQMTSSEPLKIVRLMEQLFPGTDLKVVEGMLQGISLQGSMTLSKKIAQDSTFTLEITVLPEK